MARGWFIKRLDGDGRSGNEQSGRILKRNKRENYWNFLLLFTLHKLFFRPHLEFGGSLIRKCPKLSKLDKLEFEALKTRQRFSFASSDETETITFSSY